MVYVFKTPLPKAGQSVRFASSPTKSDRQPSGSTNLTSTVGQYLYTEHKYCHGCLLLTSGPRHYCQDLLAFLYHPSTIMIYFFSKTPLPMAGQSVRFASSPPKSNRQPSGSASLLSTVGQYLFTEHTNTVMVPCLEPPVPGTTVKIY